MDQLQKLKSQVYRYILAVGLACSVATGGIIWFVWQLNLSRELGVGLIFLTSVLMVILAAVLVTHYALQPVQYIWEAVMHVSPDQMGNGAPDVSHAKAGKELITSIVMQIYQFASQQEGKGMAEHRRDLSQAANIVNHLPLPLFVFNKQQLVTNASASALEYCQLESAELFGKPLFDSLNLEFPSERTLEAWILDCQENKVIDTATWERVRVQLKDQKTVKQCDIAAYYNRDNPSGTEFIVTIFDRTKLYDQDDQSFSFVALAVHELRTPLTMLRGYIEVFEDELADTLDPEMKDFMRKMSVSAHQLTTFIGNILNIARVENNQLTLHLREQNWAELLPTICQDIVTRAQVNGKSVEFNIAKDLPTAAIDPVSISEVMNNLIDNAIKYSGESKRIIVSAGLKDDGMIETTVQDFGVGIDASVLPNMFEKFYRNHRTRAQIGGSGLGLFLCKAMITAHGGNIWASSKIGEGSTFGFTLQPYARLAEEMKSGNNEITRSAHGWIKNHSLYRR